MAGEAHRDGPGGPFTPHGIHLRLQPHWPARSFDFCFIHLDYTLVRVEEVDGRVTIRATADTFSRRRKAFFIRQLVAEGFISDDWWLSPFEGEHDSRGIRWLIDRSWLKPDKAIIERNHRAMKRCFLPLTLAWLALLCLAASGQGGIRTWVRRFRAQRRGAGTYAVQPLNAPGGKGPAHGSGDKQRSTADRFRRRKFWRSSP